MGQYAALALTRSRRLQTYIVLAIGPVDADEGSILRYGWTNFMVNLRSARVEVRTCELAEKAI